ncbi:flagellar protein FlaG [Bacillus suaedaesalsae]|uniref:Flagellar protein FlaG n=1 Tax=Bacillus suaedaesalsae TaxID=2810349 RepID=A0ABS2DCZ0_9BACI|nr:flagellar protein FlaG [Bacillus suaedaesalsae]MBM6616317.1 flagellar protein FlaG [Bacillus suaedaesalsae]
MSIDRISSNTSKLIQAELTNRTISTKPESKNDNGNSRLQEEVPKLPKDKVEEIVKGMNDFLQPSNTSLKFEMHEELKEYYVKIIDSSTQEVVKEIPSKKILDFYAEMTKFVGLLVDKKI